MINKLVLGPILGIESDTLYTVTFVTDKLATITTVEYGANVTSAILIGEIYSGLVWRAELEITAQGQQVAYQVMSGGVTMSDASGNVNWHFYVAGQNSQPQIVYGSCNGFSDYKLMTTIDKPYQLWHEMAEQHARAPFSLLLLGGDQVYADSIWTKVSLLKTWNELGVAEKAKRKATKNMCAQIDKFFSELYVERWNKLPVSIMLASIPSIMMWDDHDIIDGWGSYPEALQNCDVYKAIFTAAKKHFGLLQIRGQKHNTALLAPDIKEHFSMAVKYRGYNILALDNRSQRTLEQVMSKQQWAEISHYLQQVCITGDLLVMSAVPVVYRDFSFSESIVDITPWEEELTDDLKDHWRAKEHEGERLKLIMQLLDNAALRKAKTVILSGDVHVGCLGIIRDLRHPHATSIHQIVSSGIVHPAPTYLQWLGILAVTNDDLEYLEETRLITTDILKPHGSNKYIRARNFVTLQEGTDAKLWVNWFCEGKDKPAFPLQ